MRLCTIFYHLMASSPVRGGGLNKRMRNWKREGVCGTFIGALSPTVGAAHWSPSQLKYKMGTLAQINGSNQTPGFGCLMRTEFSLCGCKCHIPTRIRLVTCTVKTSSRRWFKPPSNPHVAEAAGASWNISNDPSPLLVTMKEQLLDSACSVCHPACVYHSD